MGRYREPNKIQRMLDSPNLTLLGQLLLMLRLWFISASNNPIPWPVANKFIADDVVIGRFFVEDLGNGLRST